MASLFVRKVKDKKTGNIKVQICSNTREGKKVKQKCNRHIGTAHNEKEFESFYRLAVAFLDVELKKINGQVLFDSFDFLEKNCTNKTTSLENKIDSTTTKISDNEPEKITIINPTEEKRVVEGPYEFYGELFKQVGFDRIFKNKDNSELLKNLIIERIANPRSKKKTRENLIRNKKIAPSLKTMYKFLDKLDEKNTEILEQSYLATNNLFENKIDIIFFDVTTLYFESITDDELRKFGYSKDQKFHTVQITLALATTENGVPVGYKLFPGNTAEVSTLINCIEEWKNNFPINDVVFVCDRGLFSFKNLNDIVQRGYKFVVAIPLKKLDKSTHQIIFENANDINFNYKIIQPKNSGEMYWAKEFNYEQKGRIILQETTESSKAKYYTASVSGRIICTYSTKRAKKDLNDRQKILEKIEKQIGLDKEGKQTKTKKAITNSGYKKYLSEKETGICEINQEKINNDAKWDGLHGIFTNTNLSIIETINRYKSLVKIEDSFRLSKSLLKMRPIYHYKPARIRGHIALCYLSLCLTKYADLILKRNGLNCSPEVLRDELNSIQSSIIKDNIDNNLYRIPSKMSDLSKKIYSCLNINRINKVSVCAPAQNNFGG